jgi:molecular chaperone DnaK
MAIDNRTLGRFDLVGIPPAPRGIPQIEVTFDIDVNGIVHVSARDLGTGQEQKIKIESSSGLSRDEIDRMVSDAKVHEAEDAEKHKLIESRNRADHAVYTTEKTLKEYGDKIDAGERKRIEEAMEKVKTVLGGNDAKGRAAKPDRSLRGMTGRARSTPILKSWMTKKRSRTRTNS